jgi:hypothetical protein
MHIVYILYCRIHGPHTWLFIFSLSDLSVFKVTVEVTTKPETDETGAPTTEIKTYSSEGVSLATPAAPPSEEGTGEKAEPDPDAAPEVVVEDAEPLWPDTEPAPEPAAEPLWPDEEPMAEPLWPDEELEPTGADEMANDDPLQLLEKQAEVEPSISLVPKAATNKAKTKKPKFRMGKKKKA